MSLQGLRELLGSLRGLQSAGRLDQALVELEAGEPALRNAGAIVWTRLDILIGLHRICDARAEFDRMLGSVAGPALLLTLLVFAPQLHENRRRTEVWHSLLETADGLARRDRIPADLLAELRARLHLALRNYPRFLDTMAAAPASCEFGGHRASLLAVAAALREPSFPDHRKPKIFGIGLSRTGTTSLAAALGEIGFNTLHWFNHLTGELICDDDLYLFDAFTDTPVSVNFERYYGMFPDAKFIYTTRPPGPWIRSVIGHFQRLTGFRDFQEFKANIGRSDRLPFGTAFESVHQSLYFDYADYASAYHAYDRRVRGFFADKPNSRFLAFDVSAGDGWQELCAFTGRAVPSTSYPYENPMTPASDRTCAYVDASNDRRRVFGPAVD
jgi:hypothetical protein